jgi:hypothetical protein
MAVIRRWPPLLWLLVYPGSLFILMGSSGDSSRPGLTAIGIALVVIAFAAALVLAYRRWHTDPRFLWAMGGVIGFYVVCAIPAAVWLGPAYATATLLAGTIPGTAAAIVLATARTDPGEGALPTLDVDDETPLGDTPEHSDAEGDPQAARFRRQQRARR